MSVYDNIITQQRSWAKSKEIKFNDVGYTTCLSDNLFTSLCPESRNEFSSGRGGELGDSKTPGKMQALHSSSALVVNFFEYWRNKDVNAIAASCGASVEMNQMHFEATHRTPLGGTPPHLDVEFTNLYRSRPLAIESKFTELYRRHTKREIAASYFMKPGLWDGLPGSEKLAKRIHEEEKGKTSFAYLDAPQLLKHILGLKTKYGLNFELLYLWYGVKSGEAAKHWLEIVEFKDSIKEEVNFRVMTYQELFEKVKNIKSVDQTYVNYLKERYFTENYNSFVDELLAYEDKYGCLVGDISSKNKRRRDDNCR